MRSIVHHRAVRGLTLLELVVSLAIVVTIFSLLLPALNEARNEANLKSCQSNLRQAGHGWHGYLEDNEQNFPHVPQQPGWRYAGYRFSSIDETPFPDMDRPLSNYLPLRNGAEGPTVLCCPADAGITGPGSGVGTGRRTAFRSYGTSYRANDALLDATWTGRHEHCGLCRSEILTVPTRLVLMGDPIWYEEREQTGRDADWHPGGSCGNLLFLDGSVKSMTVPARPRIGPAVFEPRLTNNSESGE